MLEDEGGHRLDVRHRDDLRVKLGLLQILVLGKTMSGLLRPGCGGLGLSGILGFVLKHAFSGKKGYEESGLV